MYKLNRNPAKRLIIERSLFANAMCKILFENK